MKTAILKESVKLLGTGLAITAGNRVRACKAINQDKPDMWFIRPPYGKWNDGVMRSLQDSILVHRDELTF